MKLEELYAKYGQLMIQLEVTQNAVMEIKKLIAAKLDGTGGNLDVAEPEVVEPEVVNA